VAPDGAVRDLSTPELNCSLPEIFLKFFPSSHTGLKSVQKNFCEWLPNEQFLSFGADFPHKQQFTMFQLW
jgi:hypothetical protein